MWLNYHYAVVFVDYLTEWPEVFPVKDQSTSTIATLLMEQIVSRHGVPTEFCLIGEKPFVSAIQRSGETSRFS